MSIHNRNIQEGRHNVSVESKFHNLLAKVYCFFKGHKSVLFKTEKFERNYCVCCWKEMK